MDLVDDLFGLDGQIFGERACFLMGEDEVQVFSLEQRAVSIMVAARLNGETLVEVFPELRQEGVGAVDIRNAAQAQFLDQAILQGLVHAFHAPFGLGGYWRR